MEDLTSAPQYVRGVDNAADELGDDVLLRQFADGDAAAARGDEGKDGTGGTVVSR
jgi:RNA polymerase sigma-70 factor (ECF subfamily)